jgi:hypothetical protein
VGKSGSDLNPVKVPDDVQTVLADGIAAVVWPAGRPSLTMKILTEAGLAPAAGGPPPDTARFRVVEHEALSTAAISRFQEAVRQGDAEDSNLGFCEFASGFFSRKQAFLRRWMEPRLEGQVCLNVPLEGLRGATDAWLSYLLGQLSPDVLKDAVALKLAAAVARQTVGTWPSRDVTTFRYYSPDLFDRIDSFQLSRDEVTRAYRAVLERDPDRTGMLNAQSVRTYDGLVTLLGESQEKFRLREAQEQQPLSPKEISLVYRALKATTPLPDEVRKHRDAKASLTDLRSALLRTPEFLRLYKEVDMKTVVGPPATPTLVHIHIPKTAGTSLNEVLTGFFPSTEVHSVDGDYMDLAKLSNAGLGKLRLIKGHMQHGAHELLGGNTVYLCLLRRPAPRIFSFFRYIKRQPLHPLNKMVSATGVTFGEFLLFATDIPELRNEIDNGQTRRLADMMNSAGQGREAEAFASAVANLLAPDMIFGLSERFDDYLSELHARGLIPQSQSLKSNTAPEPADLDAEVAGLTAQQRRRLDEYCLWDNWLYQIAETAYEKRITRKDRATP